MSERLTPSVAQRSDAQNLLTYQHGYLWSDPGTGKTLTALIAFETAAFSRGIVICPPIAIGMWQEEIVTQLGMKAAAVRMSLSRYNEARLAKLDEMDWLVTSYTLAPKNKMYFERFLSQGSSALILDEAHYCKSVDAKRTQAILGKPPRNRRPVRRLPRNHEYLDLADNGIAHSATSVWQLTGTPQTRWPDDLYTQLKFGRPEVLEHFEVGSYNAFVNAFCVVSSIKVNGRNVERISGAKNLTRLKALIDACKIVRRTRAQAWADLPPITHRNITIPITIPAALKQNLDENITPEEFMRQLNKSESPYARMYRIVGELKAHSVADYASETWTEPTLIGFWHKSAGQMIVHKLIDANPDARITYVDGSTPATMRDAIRDDFNAGKIDYLVGQMSALNVSWNLQECAKRVIVSEQMPSPGMLEQFYSRVYRKGQKNHVQVDHIHAEHFIDKALVEIRARKEHSTEGYLNG